MGTQQRQWKDQDQSWIPILEASTSKAANGRFGRQSLAAAKCGATDDGYGDIQQQKTNACNHQPKPHILPPQLVLELPSFPPEYKGFLLQMVCLVHEKLNAFASVQDLHNQEKTRLFLILAEHWPD